MPQAASRRIPEGMHTITVYLWFNGNCAEAFKFYQKAFGATIASPAMPGPDGKGVLHAMLKIGDSHLMMADAWAGMGDKGPEGSATAGMWLYVDNCDSVYQRAVDAGCEVIMAPHDAFWGDRFGKVRDPFGHSWAFATHKWDMTPEDMLERQKQVFADMRAQKEGAASCPAAQ